MKKDINIDIFDKIARSVVLTTGIIVFSFFVVTIFVVAPVLGIIIVSQILGSMIWAIPISFVAFCFGWVYREELLPKGTKIPFKQYYNLLKEIWSKR